MHLLHTGTRQLQSFEGSEIPEYAILSHVWGRDEVTFDQIENPPSEDGLEKIKGACSMARSHGFDYIWIDTCCINKNSSAELSEALNSMYRWYQDSAVCYAYLADVTSGSAVLEHASQAAHTEFSQSKWFTRGWTLQELIAPSLVIFFNKTWQEIGTKSSLQAAISSITGIPAAILRGDDVENASIAQRMSWASKRVTKRPEDLAYCLMGIFGVNMTMLYGEGTKAFIRLQEEIMKTSDDHSLFAWKSREGDGGLLAPSPAAFSGSHKIVPTNPSEAPSGAITINNKGVHVTLRFLDLERSPSQRVLLAILPCAVYDNAKTNVGIFLKDVVGTKQYFTRVKTGSLELFDLEESDRISYTVSHVCVRQGRRSQKRDSQLARAAISGHEATVRLLLGRSYGMDAVDTDDRHSAMELAAKNGHDAVVKLLLNDDLVVVPSLIWASKNGHERVVELLLEKNPDPKALVPAVEGAAGHGHAAVVKQLLERSIGRGLAMHHAALNGHEEVLKLLLESMTDYTEVRPAFSAAAYEGYVAVVELLLRWDISPALLRNSLSMAARNGCEAVVELLLEKDGSPEALWTALESAIIYGNGVVVPLLLEKNVGYLNLKSALELAVSHGHKAVVELLLTKDFDSQALRSMLKLAIGTRREDVVKLLLESPIDLRELESALSIAAHNGHEAMVSLLLERGIRIEAVESALESASAVGCEAVVMRLLEKNLGSPAVGLALRSAAIKGYCPVVKLLLQKDLSSQALREALMLAIDNGHNAVAELLLKEKLDIDTLESALQLAASKGEEELVKLLLEQDINSVRALGQATSSAAEHGHGAVLKLLLRKDVHARALSSALRLAASNGHEAEVKLLMQSGSRSEMEIAQALRTAVDAGHKGVVKLLLQGDFFYGLHLAMKMAAKDGNKDMAMLILERRAEWE